MPYEPSDNNLTATLCLTPLPGRSVAAAAALVSDLTDWSAVFTQAAQWDVEAVVMSNLSRFLIQYIPEPYRTQVVSREREARAFNISHALITVQLASLLEREGIRVIVIKGAAVGVSAYGDASLRGSSDIDLLVRRADLPRARRVLESNGYNCDYDLRIEPSLISGGHALELTNGRFRVELHWRLLETHLRWDPEPDEIWEFSRRVPCVGGEINVLAPHVEFLFLCAHGVKHRWLSGKWVCDIAQLAARLSDDDVLNVIALSERTRAKRILHVALRLTQEILGFSDERFPREYFSNDASVNELVVHAKGQLLGIAAASNRSRRVEMDYRLSALISWLAARESWIDKAAISFYVTFLPTGKEKLRGRAGWIVRPFNVLVTGTKAFARTRFA